MTRNSPPATHHMPALLRQEGGSCLGAAKLSKHKVRVIHVFAPEIIKTDAANFRELVQRLTGKPTKARHGGLEQDMIREGIEVEVEVEEGAADHHRLLSPGSIMQGFCGYRPAVARRASGSVDMGNQSPVWLDQD